MLPTMFFTRSVTVLNNFATALDPLVNRESSWRRSLSRFSS
jgi:hypothetical protein